MENMKVLIVARAGVLRNGLCALLSAALEGSTVEAVDGLSPALKAMRECPPEMVFLDQGITFDFLAEAIRTVKSASQNSRCVVIVESSQQAQAALNAGADDALRKGFSAAQLFQLVNK
jgi:DNA-binding NarL/FixJ family response regulator